MNCEEASEFLDAYLDNELDAGNRVELQQHLNDCYECRSLLAQQQRFRDFFAANAPYYRAPAELRARLLAKAKTRSTGKKLIALVFQPWSYAAALLVLSLSLASVILFPSKEGPLVFEAALDHSRAVLLQRLCDVVSSDPEVVKQWLTAKLGFAPPVVGLADTEFQMRGGRIDVIENRRVAALVYGRRKDLVTLFAWPAADRLLPARDWSISGYQACTWNAASFNFAAVSTLSDRDLDQFIDQVRGQLK